MDVIEAANRPHDASGDVWTTPGGRVGELLGTALGAISLLTLISLWTFSPTDISLSASSTQATENAIGPVGAYTADALFQAFGLGAYFFAFLLAVASYRAWAGAPFVPKLSELCGATSIACSGGVLLHLGAHTEKSPFPYGGVVGALLGAQTASYLGHVGALVLATAFFLMGITLLTGGMLPPVTNRLNRLFKLVRSLTPDAVPQKDENFFATVKKATLPAQKNFISFRRAGRNKLAPPKTRESDGETEFQMKPLRDSETVKPDISRQNEPSADRVDAVAEAANLFAPQLERDLQTNDASYLAEQEAWSISDKHLSEEQKADGLEEPPEDAPVGALGTSEGFEARFGGIIDHREPLLMDSASIPPPAQATDWPPEMLDVSSVADATPDLAEVSAPSSGLAAVTKRAAPALPSLDLLAADESPSGSTPPPLWFEEKLGALNAILDAAALSSTLAVQETGPMVTLIGASPINRNIDAHDYHRSLSVLFTESERALGIRVAATSQGADACVVLEIPLPEPHVPCLRACLSELRKFTEPTRITFGTDARGAAASVDLATSGAVLLAGAPQTGKTSALRALITSLAFRATPEEVQLILIDCEGSALSCFAGLPHLALPLVTDARGTAQALRWILNEAEDRNQSLLAAGAGEPQTGDAFAQIVVVIDELSPLMQAIPSDIESFVTRIAPIGRAVGVSLIAATHALTPRVITGALKHHFATRVAFRVDDRRAGRALLEEGGAELLLARGDALLSPGAGLAAERRHCVLMTAAEAEDVTAALKQRSSAGPEEEALPYSSSETVLMPPH